MPTRPLSPTFDVREIPFSLRGSWLDVSPVIGLHRTAEDLHLVSHHQGLHPVLRLVPHRGGSRAAARVTATPSLLTWADDGGRIELAFGDTSTLRIRGRGLDLRLENAAELLTPFTGTYAFTDPRTGDPTLTSYETGRRYRVTALHGRVALEGDGALGRAARAVTATGEGGWEIEIEEFDGAPTPPPAAGRPTFEAVESAAAAGFARYLEDVAGWRSDRTPAAELAAYVLWSATVEPRGFVGRESILMSKHWMDKVWSWDHCFNALALAPGSTDRALDQFLTVFDHQDDAGALPDSVTHAEVLRNFVKPPIHGWALDRIRAVAARPLTAEELRTVHDRLAAWTRFWLVSRRAPGHDLPHYQHGNDSGWDNATVFDHDRVVESPDLAAFLVVQLDVLVRLARELGTHEAERWRAHRDTVRLALLADLWDGERFVARAVRGRRPSKTSSLLTLLPLVASDFLPEDVRTTLAAGVERHLTAFGPATEPVDSPDYEADGYWRGPVWAPSTLLIEDGLRRSGATGLADRVSAAFRGLCERSGFAENFDAVTGAGLRDRAYTWTASAYLVLSREAEIRAASPRRQAASAAIRTE